MDVLYAKVMKRSTLFIIVILFSLGIYAAWLNWIVTPSGCTGVCAFLFRGIVDGTADSPYRYRILTTFFMDAIGNHPRSDGEIAITYAVAHLILMPLVITSYYLALRRWLAPLSAIAGVILYVALLPAMYRIYSIGVYTPVELGLLSLALWWRRPDWRYAALVVLASLNRETGVLLVLTFAAIHLPRWRERRIQVWTLIFAALWAACFVGLRLWRGPAPDLVTIAEIWEGNTNSWQVPDAITNHFFFLPLYFAVPIAWRKLPPEVKRLFIGVALPYLGLTAVFGSWNEIRLIMPIMPFLTVAFFTTLEQMPKRIPATTDEKAKQISETNRVDNAGVVPTKQGLL